jgi:uncharacterized protein (DUF2252 family)
MSAAAPKARASARRAVPASPGRRPTSPSRQRRRSPSLLEPVRDLSRAELRELGRRRRTDATRKAQGQWRPSADRPDPIAVIDATNASRVPELVPIRWGRMLDSPFTFLRGAPAVLAMDLADLPRSGMQPQICGDAHCLNFGAFATPERHLAFDVNDFDETMPGPWEWDLKRLVASLAVAARTKSMSDEQARAAAVSAAARYRSVMADLVERSVMEGWYARVDVDTLIELAQNPEMKAQMRKEEAKAERRDSLQALGKLTTLVDGQPRIVDKPPLIVHRGDRPTRMRRLRAVYDRYVETLQSDRRRLIEEFHFTDAAFKVVGVGSVGTRCHIALLQARTTAEPLFLQLKEADPSVLETHLGPSAYRHHGERVVAGQRLMQAASDAFLGWTSLGRVRYYVRQLRDMKYSVNVAAAPASVLEGYGQVCGATLARAHARTCDPALISGYLGTGDAFDKAMGSFAMAYADQTERDHEALVKAYKAGRVPAEIGV